MLHPMQNSRDSLMHSSATVTPSNPSYHSYKAFINLYANHFEVMPKLASLCSHCIVNLKSKSHVKELKLCIVRITDYLEIFIHRILR